MWAACAWRPTRESRSGRFPPSRESGRLPRAGSCGSARSRPRAAAGRQALVARWPLAGPRPEGRIPSVPLVLERVEPVEAPGRRHLGHVLGRKVREPSGAGELTHPPDIVAGEFLNPGVRAERPDLPADVDDGLIERVPERPGRVATDQNGPGLRHEAAHVTGVACNGDRAALE